MRRREAKRDAQGQQDRAGVRILPTVRGVAQSQRGAIGSQARLMLADIGTVRYVSSRGCFPVSSFNSAVAEKTPSQQPQQCVSPSRCADDSHVGPLLIPGALL